jgi:hypothetical protein
MAEAKSVPVLFVKDPIVLPGMVVPAVSAMHYHPTETTNHDSNRRDRGAMASTRRWRRRGVQVHRALDRDTGLFPAVALGVDRRQSHRAGLAYNGDLSMRVGLIRQAGRKLHVKLPHFEHYNVSSGKSLLRNRYNELGAKPVRERTDGLPLRRSRRGGHRIQVRPPDGFRSPENQRQGGRRWMKHGWPDWGWAS